MQDVTWPTTRFTRWRLRSTLCATADVMAALAGAGLFVLAAVDSVASWPSDRVLLTDPELARVAGIVLLPGWPWMMASFLMVFGVPRRRPRTRRRNSPWRRLPLPGRIAIWAVAAACAAVVAGSYAVGAAKGSARVLPGPRYEVSVIYLNNLQWTQVTHAQYQMWQAQFVREDSFFTTFGLFLAAASIGFLRLRRRGADQSAQGLPPLPELRAGG